MGLPTVAMGLLTVAMPVSQAAAILVIPSFVTNIWQLLAGSSFRALLARLWTMMLGVIVGTIESAGLLTGGHSGVALTGLGISLICYALFGLFALRLRVDPRHEVWLSPLVGVTTGIVTGATGVFVLPAVPYLQALKLERDDLIQALGLSFTVSTIALALGLSRAGGFRSTGGLLSLSCYALVPALLGMFLGQNLRHRMSVETFRKVFFVGLLLLGCYIVAESILKSAA